MSVHLCNADIEHLNKMAVATDFKGVVHLYENDCYLSFSGEWFKQSLENNFDIFPRKTFDIKISNKIPEDMIVHFLRGYFDGDGSVTHTDKYLRINFASGSVALLNQIMDFIYDNGIYVRNDDKKPKITNGCLLSYSCNNAYKILDMLYSCSTELTRLERKYNLYLKWREQYDW